MLNPDFSDMLSCLKSEGVEFIIVGAFALAAHGNPRATGDIDIWVRADPANAEKIVRALRAFGAALSDVAESDFISPNQVLQIGVEPNRIDVLTTIDGIDFAVAWRNRVTVNLQGVEVCVLSKADLLTNKIASGRDKDLGDIAWLRKNLNSNI